MSQVVRSTFGVPALLVVWVRVWLGWKLVRPSTTTWTVTISRLT